MVIHVWLKLEIISMFLEPTILILLALTKPAPEKPGEIVPTYGRLSAINSGEFDKNISED